ncbi:MarR family winged helix-turn-helix transcriptional regulator [Companilactobacillus kedongensis]|uniref:MarR family winged helix-turn-helix transcriptional regulator n=1 Tax=Companilactobacillus kedongensis TaxID=2486004 RepID=UPI0013DDDB99|nr:MarR family winged helix-turn-helix transcriptional regulator [Companilactobacillus kedongensis]
MDIIKLGKFIGAIHRRFQIAMNHELTLPELNASNANFLLLISDHDQITAKQITAELAINKGLVSREMTRLENAGYIIKTPDDTDHRTTWLHITPQGLNACTAIRKIKMELWDQMLVDTNDEDLKTIFNSLESWSEQTKKFEQSE